MVSAGGRAALTALALSLAAPAGAATFTATALPDGRPALLIEGPIIEGDQVRLDATWAAHPSVQAVVLSSPGGLILPALHMGDTIRRGGLATIVMPDALCASACADIWLSGIHRILPPGARVGFHGIYGKDGKTLTMTGAGNGLVGAYMARLGYSDDAVVFATAAQPDEISWLTWQQPFGPSGITFETRFPSQLRADQVWNDGQMQAAVVPAAPNPPKASLPSLSKPAPKPARSAAPMDITRFSSDPAAKQLMTQ